jgi:hypothetical protein
MHFLVFTCFLSAPASTMDLLVFSSAEQPPPGSPAGGWDGSNGMGGPTESPRGIGIERKRRFAPTTAELFAMRRIRQLNAASRLARQSAPRGPGKEVVRRAPLSKRARGGEANIRLPFVPPETWHEPHDDGNGYRFLVQPPGEGYRHVVTPDEVRERLDQLPDEFLRPLDLVQFSRMTRKKQSFPCYGMQWGATIYLYPIEESLVESYTQPPKPSQVNEARMFGGRWVQESPSTWNLIWTQGSIKDFYLNNILIHELGHLLDDRNSRAADREGFAEWFAIRYGYQATRRPGGHRRSVRRGHGRHK